MTGKEINRFEYGKNGCCYIYFDWQLIEEKEAVLINLITSIANEKKCVNKC
jgi:hypothetical protein